MTGSIPRIYLGRDHEQKRAIVRDTLDALHDVDRVFVFYGTKEAPDFNFEECETVYVPWPETEMYRTFYPLQGVPYEGKAVNPPPGASYNGPVPAITHASLLIVDEMLMQTQRTVLRYNCMQHFLRLSERRLVFNWLPFLEDQEDFMILADYAEPDLHRHHPFSPDVLKLADIIPRLPTLARTEVETTEKDREAYEKKKETLFDSLGDKDPNTIPRNLILLAGAIKARAVSENEWYVARNKRFKKPHIVTYAENIPSDEINIKILDPTYKRRDLVEFMRRNSIDLLNYMTTSLPVDKVYYDDLGEWIDRLEAIYDAADIHQ